VKLASPMGTGVQPELTKTQARGVLSALKEATGDAQVVNPPTRAPYGRRWSDVPTAVSMAAAKIEGAVFRKIALTDAYEFKIRRINGQPVDLFVQRVEGSQVYTASATAGLFKDDPAMADHLLAALDRALLRLGKNKQFQEPVKGAKR
jgi:hypothetical protein